MSILIQRSLAAGEIGPNLYARTDTAKYAAAAKTVRNFQILQSGGAANRAGLQYVAEISSSSVSARLIPFVFNDEQTYVLEFGTEYMRVVREAELLGETAIALSAISKASPGVFTSNGHGLSNGNEVLVAAVVGMTEVNNFRGYVANATANTFTLTNKAGTALNTTNFSTYVSGGTVAKVYQITTPYQFDHLLNLQYSQNADIVPIVNNYYKPRQLARTDHTSWSLSVMDFTISQAAPVLSAITPGSPSTAYRYVVTAVNAETLEETVRSNEKNTDHVPAAGDVNQISWSALSGVAYYKVYRASGSGGSFGFIGTAEGTATDFQDAGYTPDSTDNPPSARNPFDLETAVNITGATQANPGVITATSHGMKTGDPCLIESVGGMTQLNDIYFTIVKISANTFSLKTLAGVAVDTSGYGAYTAGGTVKPARNFPAAIAYIQQRLSMGGSLKYPQKVYCSRTGRTNNFTNSPQGDADDSVTFDVPGKKVNQIKHLLDVDGLKALTSGAVVEIGGDDSGIIRPGDVNPNTKSLIGSSTLQPILIGENLIMLQARANKIIDLNAQNAEGVKGRDLTIYAPHLFRGHTIIDWAFQEIPNSIIWAVRDDGVLLGCTYLPEQQVWGWHRHDTDGLFERVCVVPGSTQDEVYFQVKRTIDGVTKRYIEKLSSREITNENVVDATFIDSFLTYDGRNTGAVTMTLSLDSGGSTWDENEELVITASSATFLSTDVGNEIHVEDEDGDIIRCEITEYTNSTTVKAIPHMTVPSDLRAAATAVWSRAVDVVQGLWHLEGEDVAVFADGFVIANPNNDSYTDVLTVENGEITMPQNRCYAVIHVGLPYISDLETLDIDTVNGESMILKKKQINEVGLHVEGTMGAWVGPAAPTDDDDDPKENLTEVVIRENETMEQRIQLKDGVINQLIQAQWNSNGRVFIRNLDPIPLTVLSVAPSGWIPA